MLNLKALKEAAEKVGGREWFVDSKPTLSGMARVDDGTSGMHPITAEWHEARFIALANPSAILSLIERYEALRVVVENLHTALTEDYSLINGGDSDDVAWFVERARLALSNPTETVK